MKRKPVLIVTLAVLILLSLTQCLSTDDPRPTEVTKTTELNISPSFDWNLTSEMEFSVTGIPGAVDNRKTLILHSGDIIWYKELYNINQNISRKIHIPEDVTSVTITFGDFSKNIPITGGKIEFSFHTDVNN